MAINRQHLTNSDIGVTLNQFINYKLDELIREKSDFSFVVAKDLVNRILNVINEITKSDGFLKEFPSFNNNSLKNSLINILFDTIKNFDVNASNPAQQRDGLINQIRKNYSEIYSQLIIPFENYKLRNNLQATNLSEIQEKLEQADSFLKDLESKNQAGAEATGDIASHEYAKIFNDQADQNLKLGGLWLVLSVAFAVVIGCFTWWAFTNSQDILDKNHSVEQLIFLGFSKLLIFSFLTYLMYQCVRQTNINFHISSNYRYKANALEVFSAFRETSSSEESKDRITEQVVSYIYTTDDSGFITSKDKDIKIEGLDALAKFK